MPLRKVDLHVHSEYSEIKKGVLKTIIHSESYTPPKQVYRIAKKRGMDFVTITDHDSILGALEIAHLDDVFISEEVTVTFPEDGCQIHVVALNINERQHEEIQRLKDNIYELVRYFSLERIIHFVAHPFSSVNGKLKPENWEKMLLLFDVFEVRNGVQKEKDNRLLEKILQNLTPEKIEELSNRYNLSPVSSTPWKKSMVGGSDDHGGLYIGETYTVGEGEGIEDFLISIKEGRSKPGGKSGTSLTIGRSIYATGYKFYKYRLKGKKISGIFDNIVIGRIKGRFLEKLFFKRKKIVSLFFKGFLLSYFIRHFSKRMHFLHTVRSVRKINKNLPLYTALFPYLFGLAYQNKDRNFLWRVKKHYLNQEEPLKVAIFVDINDNFLSFSLPDNLPLSKKEKMEIICCSKKENFSTNGIKVFSSVTNFPFPLFPEIRLYIPSLLEILFYCEEKEFTMIHTLTPGPMGVAGVLTSKILNLPVVGVYNRNFSSFIQYFDGSSSLKRVLWRYFSWYYSQMQAIIVTSKEYIGELREKNIPSERIKLLSIKEGEKLNSTPADLFSPNEWLKSIFQEGVSIKLWEIYKQIVYS